MISALTTPRGLVCRLLGALALLTPLLVAGCGVSGAARGTVLTIWYGTDDPVERLWSQQLAQRFHASHPTVAVRLTDYSFEDMNTKLQLALSSGDPPDLAYTTPRGPGIPAYVGAHRLRNLASVARHDGWAQRLRPDLLSTYNRPFAYEGSSKGSIVAVPSALAAVGIMVNTRILHQLHLSVPRTLGQFQATLQRAKAAGDVPIGMGNADGWLGDDWYLTLVNALMPPASLAREQLLDPAFTFRRPAFVRAGQILRDWSRAGYFTPDFAGLDAQEGVDQFFHGRTLFQLISSSENSQIDGDQRQTRLPIGVFAFPREGGGTVMPLSGYEGWAVPRAAKNPAAATGFIGYVISAQGGDFLLRHGALPSIAHVAPSRSAPVWQRQYVSALRASTPGVYIDAAPIANMNATMEANVQLLLQGYEPPTFLITSLEKVYSSRGLHGGSTNRIDGEF